MNNIHLFDVGLSYQATPRWSLHFSAPMMKATRKRASAADDQMSHSAGLGDMSFGAKVWLFRPPTEAGGNVQVGISMKVPTGKYDVTDTLGTGATTRTVIVDQSIQLGDGGTGFSLDMSAFKPIRRFTVFGTAIYLFNPRNTNGVLTGRRASEAIMSVPDAYLLRAGLGYAVPKLRGLAFTGAWRWEGISVRDLIGKEDGFRRPGYAISLEPGVQYARGRNTWSVTAPIAVQRNRRRSVSDIADGRHGDAAFADYLITAGYSRSF